MGSINSTPSQLLRKKIKLIYLFVNGQHIDEVKDNNYSKGKIGVLAKTFGPYLTEVAFSDATVWTL